MNATSSDIGKKALKAGAWYMISTIAVKAINVITTPIFTRMLSTEDYGIAANFSSWYALLVVIFSLNVELSVGRAKQDYQGNLNKYIGSLELLCVIVSISVSLCIIPFWSKISKLMELSPLTLFLLIIYLLFAPVVQLTQTRLRYDYKYKGNIAITVFITISSIGITLAFLMFMQENRYLGKVLGSVIPTVVLGSAFWIREIRHKNISINKEYWKYALAITLPMLIHTLAMNLLSQSDRVVITKLCGSDATGVYSLAYQYAILINIIMQAISQAWLPWFHDNYYLGNKTIIKDKVKVITVFGCYVGVGCISLAPEAISLLGPEAYSEGLYVIAPVALGIICQFMYSNYINIELHMKNTKYASIGTMIAACFNIVANYIFIPIFGFIAAAYTTLASYVLLWIIHLIITKRILKVKLYDDKFFLFSIIVSALVSCVLHCLYGVFLLRMLVMLIISIIILISYRTEAKSFVQSIKKRRR